MYNKIIFSLFFIGGIVNCHSNCVKLDAAKGICTIEGKGYPSVGFGTFPLKDDVCKEAVEQAIASGYRIIDTATFYENFESIGQALRSQDRTHFYLISKVWPTMQAPQKMRQDLESALRKLQTDYIDAYLLHWPNSAIPIDQIISVLKEFQKEKKIRHIGLSNVSVNHVKKALEHGLPIAWVQVEMHPHFCDQALLHFCKEHGIVIQAWAPLNRGGLSHDKLLSEIGARYGKSPSQVALRWIVQHGCVPLPGSKDPRHIQENRECNEFSLSEEEIQEIDQRAFSGKRFRLTEEYGFGFTDEFDFTYDECWQLNRNFHAQAIP